MIQGKRYAMGKLDLLIRSISILLACLIFTKTLSADTLSSTAYLLVNQALFITLISYLLLPLPKSTVGFLSNSVLAVLLFLVLSQLTVSRTVPAQALFRICVVILGFSLSLWSLNRLLAAILPGCSHTRNTTLLTAAVVISAPVWLGPFVEISQPGDYFINGIISLTPLTHFSVAAEYDYLRSAWFYQNTPFGSLPFAYPGLISIAAVYLVLVVLMQIISWRITHTVMDPVQPHRHSFNNS